MGVVFFIAFFFFSSRRRHTRCSRDWSSDVCSSDLAELDALELAAAGPGPDRGRPERRVGGGEVLGRLGQADPVPRGPGHRQSPPSAVEVVVVAGPLELDAPPSPPLVPAAAPAPAPP